MEHKYILEIKEQQNKIAHCEMRYTTDVKKLENENHASCG
jgi:lipid II:glycine glycyltransferase (peptidoglycan interpeptide bridge formation enzyme)